MNFIFFSTILWDWAGGAHQSTQVSLEIARRGHHVLFIQSRPSVNRETFNLPIHILSLVDLGLSDGLVERAWHGLDVGSLEGVAKGLLAAVDAMEDPGAPRMAIWFSPFDPFARLLPPVRARGYHAIYFPQDDFGAMVQLGFHRPNRGAEDYLGQEAEVIMTLSEPVAQKMRRFGKNVYVIPDGINLAEFREGPSASAPPDVLHGERTLGFWGWLDETMVDHEPIRYVARERPTWAINLIGGSSSETGHPSLADELKDLNNIRFHGEVSHRDLAAFGSCFDVCLIPAPDNDFSRGRDPIKVYEYLALHKPVVCTHMSQLAGMPYVRNASTPQEFLQEVETALVTPVDAQALDDFLAKQTWAARVDALLEVIGSLGGGEPPGILRDAPGISAGSLIVPSFAQESPGVQAYLSQLERDLAETRRWARELESAAIAKDRELKRIYEFLPIRILRWLYHFFA